jgi:hypothetical protein
LVLGPKGKVKDIAYDVGILGKKPIPGHILIKIEESLEESDLPYKIDIVDFILVSPEFRKIALSNNNEKQADKIYKQALKFPKEVDKLLKQLQKLVF